MTVRRGVAGPSRKGGDMGSLLRDFRYSYRLFLQTPGFVAAALLSLALGIGANTTIFSVLNAILLRPFPVKEPGRLAVLFENNRQGDDMRGGTRPTYALVPNENECYHGAPVPR